MGGIVGECGMRGGYLELVHIHPETKAGDPSYESYKAEFDKIFQSLQCRALKLNKGLNSLEGVTCQPSSGAMYAFPNVTFPQKWLDQCKTKGIPADTAYCLELLD